MEIYIRTNMVMSNDEYIENGRRNFLSYDNCKASIKEYIEELIRDVNNVKIEKEEENTLRPYHMYTIKVSWTGVGNTIHKEMFTIHKEYVY